MKVELASIEDLTEILELQIRAYQSEAEIYNDYSIEPLIETPLELQKQFKHKTFMKAVLNGEIVGSVRGYLKGGTAHIGRLAVEPNFQNQGIGTQLIGSIEVYFPSVERYELFTGNKSKSNLRLYNKLGYREFKREPVGDQVMMVYLVKYRNPG
ncbi:MAG: GNAT family N-acetyltransferase [Nitrososphaerota archaeon]